MLEPLDISIYAVGLAFLVKAAVVLILVGQTAIRQSGIERVSNEEVAVHSHNERGTDELAQRTLTKEQRRASC